jgi:hypothetical protein
MVVPGPVRRRLADYTVETDNSEVIVNGEVEQNAKTTETKSLAIFRLTFKDLRHAPEGQWDSNDIKMYEVGEATIPAESVVTFEGDKFRVLMISDRNKDGGFTMYWAKRIGENETSTE